MSDLHRTADDRGIGAPLNGHRAILAGVRLVMSRHPLLSAVLILAAVGQAAVLALGVGMARRVLAGWLTGDHALTSAVPLLALVFLQFVIAGIREAAEAVLHQTLAAEISVEVLARVADVPYEKVQDNGWQAELGLVLREASYRPGFLLQSAISAAQSSLALIGLFVGMAVALSPVVLLLPVLVTPALVVEAQLRRRVMNVQTASAPLLLRMQMLSQMSIDADWQRDVRVARSTILYDEYARSSTDYLRLLRRVVLRGEVSRSIVGALVTLLIIVGAAVILSGQLNPAKSGSATATVLLAAATLAAGFVRSLVSGIGEIIESSQYLQILLAFITGPRPPVEIRPLDAPEVEGLSVQNVSYRYPEASTPAVNGFSAELTIGLTAVTGPNGAGKSTLVKLLVGLLDPQRGSIVVRTGDGENRDIGAVACGVLFQDSSHLRLSVRQFITLRSGPGPGVDPPTVDDALIWQALTDAGLADLVERMPDRLETQLGAGFGGVQDLSGGQWQRLALARLYFTDAPILICDEPTSGLDLVAEEAFLSKLVELSRTRIVVLITHRPDTILRSHQVIYVDRGQVRWSGEPHDHTVADFYSSMLPETAPRRDKGRSGEMRR